VIMGGKIDLYGKKARRRAEDFKKKGKSPPGPASGEVDISSKGGEGAGKREDRSHILRGVKGTQWEKGMKFPNAQRVLER